MTILLLFGDHPGDGVQLHYWTVGDHPYDGGWPSMGWWVTNLWMVGYLPGMVFDHPGDHWGPSFGNWVTIFWKVGDHIFDGG